MIRKSSYKLAFFSLFCILNSCNNPFFAQYIKPSETNYSPRDVIEKQLKKAYELRSIELFKKIVYSKDEFRFYLEHNIDSLNLQNINKNQYEKVIIDKEVDFIVADDSTYVYLTYSQEEKIHSNMFRETEEIIFVSFNVYNVKYFDSLNNSGTYDTTEAIIYTEEAEIDMTAEVFARVYGNRKQRFQVGKQVFFLKKDNQGIWKLRLWFELGRKVPA